MHKNVKHITMEETVEDFYKYLLRIGGPWEVLKITHKDETEEVTVEVGIKSRGKSPKSEMYRTWHQTEKEDCQHESVC